MTLNEIINLDDEEVYKKEILMNNREMDNLSHMRADYVYKEEFLNNIYEYITENRDGAYNLIMKEIITPSSPLFEEMRQEAINNSDTAELFTLIYNNIIEVNESQFDLIFNKRLNHPWPAYNLIKLGLIQPGDFYYDKVKAVADNFHESK